MVEILGAQMPTLFNRASAGFSINWVLILAIILIVIAGAVTIYLIVMYRTYNKRIILFENIAGLGFQPTLRDKARTLKLGDGGEELFWLKKKKVFRTAYGRKMGKNTYWFAVGQDGYWYNVTLGDLDARLGMLDISPVDRDLRYMHTAVRKNITERYRKVKFMEKYGTILMSGIFVLIMLIGLGILINKMGDVASTINFGIEASNKVVTSAGALLDKLNGVNSPSGVIPAT